MWILEVRRIHVSTIGQFSQRYDSYLGAVDSTDFQAVHDEALGNMVSVIVTCRAAGRRQCGVRHHIPGRLQLGD
jgi:hypothetical protein